MQWKIYSFCNSFIHNSSMCYTHLVYPSVFPSLCFSNRRTLRNYPITFAFRHLRRKFKKSLHSVGKRSIHGQLSPRRCTTLKFIRGWNSFVKMSHRSLASGLGPGLVFPQLLSCKSLDTRRAILFLPPTLTTVKDG